MNHDDDLTASHWDDVLSSNTQSTYLTTNNTFGAPEFNAFNDLSLKDQNENDDEDDEEDQAPQQAQTDEVEEEDDEGDTHVASAYLGSAYDTARSELDQLHEMKKEERQQHRTQLMSELAADDQQFDTELEKSTLSPERASSTDLLFNDKGSPIKIDYNQVETNKTPKKPKNAKLFKRPRKFSAQKNAKHLSNDQKVLESENDKTPLPENGNKEDLGPLGTNNNQSTDDLSTKSNPKLDLVKETEAPLYNIKGEEEKDFSKPQNLPPTPRSNNENDTNKNQLDISVGDPMKVGDITNAHIVYTIKTHNKNLESGNFPKQQEPFVVTRRYKDFRWIYHQLQNNHMGRIIPPPPAKQTYIGRFNESFIENRRLSLEKMLNKISNILVLSNDDDFIMFLTSEDFTNESKERERISGSGASLQNNDSLDNENNLTDTTADTSSSNNGFMSSIFSMSNKIDEPDEYFDSKKHYIENLEVNLKNFYQAIELIINQRIDIVNIIEQVSITVEELANIEISKKTSELLLAFNDIQIKLKDNLDRINLQDHLTLGFTIEEYLRIIGSIKFIFDQRLKIYQSYQNYLTDLTKKKSQLSKSKLKNQIDKVNQLNFEVDKLSTRTETFEKKFKSVSEIIKTELENFEFEKIDDFRNSVEIFIESSIESQKESIELWETFYERQHLSQY